MTEPELSPEELQQGMLEFYDKVIKSFILTYSWLDRAVDLIPQDTDVIWEGVIDHLNTYKPFFDALTQEE